MDSRILTLEIDYSLTKLQMIEAGHYDYVDAFLLANDPVEGLISGSRTIRVNLELVHFNRVISTADILKETKALGLISAGIEHLLALGAAHPNLQNEFPIVAFGSVWQYLIGGRAVPYLRRFKAMRLMDSMGSIHDSLYWTEEYHFLTVRKPGA